MKRVRIFAGVLLVVAGYAALFTGFPKVMLAIGAGVATVSSLVFLWWVIGMWSQGE